MGVLQNKVVLITGSTRGWGAFVAAELARSGCRVILNFTHNSADARRMEEKINSIGCCAGMFRADVADDEEVGALFLNLAECFENVDVLINAAGANCRGDDVDFQDILDRSAAISLKGTLLCCKYFFQYFSGTVVNTVAFPDTVPGVSGKDLLLARTMVVSGIRGVTDFFAAGHPGSPVHFFDPGSGESASSAAAADALVKLLD